MVSEVMVNCVVLLLPTGNGNTKAVVVVNINAVTIESSCIEDMQIIFFAVSTRVIRNELSYPESGR